VKWGEVNIMKSVAKNGNASKNEKVEEIFDLSKMSKEGIEVIKALFPNYIETYGDWVRLEFIYVPANMISFDWKQKLRDLGIDAVKQEFIRRGYNLKRRVQTLDYDLDGQKKKIKIIMWELDRKFY